MVNHIEDKVFSFIDEISYLNDSDEVFDVLFNYAKYFGFNSFLMGKVPVPGEIFSDNVISNHWPDGWYQRYMGKNYFEVDAVALNLQNTLEPYFWSDVSIREDDKISKIIQHEAREFDLKNGCCVPIYSRNGFMAGITFGTDKLEISRNELAAIYLMSLYAFNSTIEWPGRGCNQQQCDLSARE